MINGYEISADQIVLIAGPSGSGKSTLAKSLSDIFGCDILNLDRYFLDESMVPKEPGGNDSLVPQWESVTALDVDRIRKDIGTIINSKTCLVPIYSFEENKRVGEEVVFFRGCGLIIDGINSFFFSGLIRELRLKCLKLYIDIDVDYRDQILRKRDSEDRKKSDAYFFERLATLKTGEMRWIHAQKGDADLVVKRMRSISFS